MLLPVLGWYMYQVRNQSKLVKKEGRKERRKQERKENRRGKRKEAREEGKKERWKQERKEEECRVSHKLSRMQLHRGIEKKIMELSRK